MHRFGQENRAGLAIWAVMSMPVFNILHKARFNTKFQAPLNHDKVHFAAHNLVDDMDLPQAAEDEDELDQAVVSNSQESWDIWEVGI
jgi:hypothetical protein